ncbi:major facilitator superfamily domain-containing protein [Aspergillus lucknowensis]|uniref:Major facilitator superfamily domain-containing protein n=1 Tax=Aspergillus lucknowensis TaxID=176173 RepID=A0ABR4LFC7_9EURO
MSTLNDSNVPRDVIPGTIHLVNIQIEEIDGQRHIELVPTPSSDPEDPLNWAPKRKLISMIMVNVYTALIGIALTVQYSVLADITRDTGISTASLVEGTGLMFLFLGWGCLVWQPIALTYGRRGVYIISSLLCVPLLVWTAYSKTTADWYAHRILVGLAGSPIESVPEMSIPDVHFAHDRGMWMAIYVFTLFASNFLAPVIAGWLALAAGWRWVMNFGAICAGVATLALFFFMEETKYFRNTLEGVSDGAADPPAENVHIKREGDPEARCTAREDVGDGTDTHSAEKLEINKACEPENQCTGAGFTAIIAPTKKTFMQRMKLFANMPGQPTFAETIRTAHLPLVLLFQFPNVVWAGLIYGINLSLYNVLNATTSPILSAPPYSWSSGLVGTVYVGPIIGAALGSLWSGKVADAYTLYLARRNGGIREAEQRLWPLAVSAVLSAVGLILWGVGAAHGIHWVGLAFGSGILTFSAVTGGSIALSYNVDCFKDISGPSTTTVIIIRNTIGFAISYGITPWYTNMGLTGCFTMAGVLSMACTLTFLIMIWKGKAMRKFCAPRYWKYVGEGLMRHP